MFPLDFPPPKNSDDFDTICLSAFASQLKPVTIQKYGRKGHKQDGVDIIADCGKGFFVGIQCKLREHGSKLTNAEILAETEKAKLFTPRLSKYIIATTSKRCPKTQNDVIRLSSQLQSEDLFSVEILFWDDINDLASIDTACRNCFIKVLGPASPSALRQHADDLQSNASQDIKHGPHEPIDIHVSIDRAAKFLNANLLDEAQSELDEILKVNGGRCTPSCRHRINANLGHIHARRGNYSEAATYYEKAWSSEKERPEAIELRAHSMLIRGNYKECHECVKKLIDSGHNSDKAYALLLSSLPDDVSIDDALGLVPETFQSKPQPAQALASIAFHTGDIEKAHEYATIAARDANWSHAQILLAEIKLERIHSSILTRAEIASEAEDAASLLLASLNRNYSGDVPGKWRVEFRLAECYYYLDYNSLAINHARNAEKNFDGEVGAYVRLALLFHNLGENEHAMDMLSTKSDEVYAALSLCKLKLAIDGSDHLNDMISLMGNFSEIAPLVGPGTWQDWFEVCVDLFLRTKRYDDLKSFIDTQGSLPDQCQLYLARARHEHAAHGVSDDFISLIQVSIDKINSETHNYTKRRLATLLEKTSDFPSARSLWVDISRSEKLSENDYRHLINCCIKISKWNDVAKYSKEYRDEHGLQERDVVYAEIEANARLAPLGVVDVISSLRDLTTDPDLKSELEVARQCQELRNKSRHSTSITIGDIHSPEDSPDVLAGLRAVEVLRYGPSPEQAMEYAYRLFRTFPDAVEAWEAVIRAKSMEGPVTYEFPERETVAPGDAVEYSTDSSSSVWHIIEDALNPKPSLGEFSPEDQVSLNLIGKRPGDTFVIRENPPPARTGIIKNVVSKYQFRWQFCFSDIESRFGEDSPIIGISVPYKSDGSIDIDQFGKQIAYFSGDIAELMEKYRSTPLCSIYSLAAHYGVTCVEMMQIIIHRRDDKIRCTAGDLQSREKGTNAALRARSLVIDDTAISTIMHLCILSGSRLPDFLSGFDCQIYISEYVVTCLRKLARYGQDNAKSVATAGVDAGQLRITENNKSAGDRLESQVTKFLNELESIAHVIPRSSIVDQPESVSELSMFLSPSIIQCLSHAKLTGATLWTEDHPIALLAEHRLGIPRTWTQAILLSGVMGNSLSQETIDDIIINLYYSGYDYTSLSHSQVIRAGSRSGWNVSDEIFDCILSEYSNSNISKRSIVISVIRVISHVFAVPMVSGVPEIVLRKILVYIRKREDYSSVVFGIKQGIVSTFIHNLRVQREALAVIESFGRVSD